MLITPQPARYQLSLHAEGVQVAIFLLLWLAGWTVGGLGAMGTVLGQFAGRELLTVDATALAHRIEIFGLSFTRHYAAGDVKALRATPDSGLAQYQAWMHRSWGLSAAARTSKT